MYIEGMVSAGTVTVMGMGTHSIPLIYPTNTYHYFVIPDDDQDVITPFVCYDIDGPFPELLATNGHNCTIHSCPLHAHTDVQGCTPLFPCDKLLFIDKLLYSSTIDYAIRQEDNPTLMGKVKHFCSHHKKAAKLA